MKRGLTVFLIFLLLFILTFWLQGSQLEVNKRRVYTAHAVNPHPPVIDGKFNDVVWEKAEWESHFIQRQPVEGEKASQKTSFKILFDNKNLYVAIRAYDTEPDKIVRRMSRRDNLSGDWVGIEIDSYFDHRTAFCFKTNAAGVKYDEMITEDGNNSDDSWDPIWYVATQIDKEGWTAEMRIPFNQLRFASHADHHTWGLQVSRQLFRKEEVSNWQHIPKTAPGWVNSFGELKGIGVIDSKRNIQLIPYTVGKTESFEAEEGNPFSTGKANNLVGGLDGKIALTSDLTMDFTVNPDFGQVEADPSEVNLSAFETYFEEKRPFFIEGRNILNFGITGGDGTFSQDNLFYSRRIGRTPHHEPDTNDDEYVDMPTNTSILGAVKITGKTRNGLSIGILDSLTAPETAQIDFQGQRREEAVEPLTNYFIMRVQKDYNSGNTVIGGMFTATHRNLKDEVLNYLHKSAYTGGFDLSHSWKKKTYYVNLNTVFSHVRGSEEAILETQESALRYYQRPDADHLTLDPTRRSLSGHGGTFTMGKDGNGRLRYDVGVTWRSPGLELNDVGYLYRSDMIMQSSWIGYRIYKPFWIFKSVNFNLNQWRGWDFDNTRIFGGGNINGYTQFKNYWGINFGLSYQENATSVNMLRGGPAVKWPGGNGYWGNIHTDRRKPFYIRFGTYYSKRWDAAEYEGVWMSMTYQPATNLSMSISPEIDWDKNKLQYVDTIELDNDESRYLMATINQKTFLVTVRVNYSITPELSIQLYGQPYLSAGKYTNFKRITEPKAKRFEDRYQEYASNQLTYRGDDEMYDVDEDGDGNVDFSFDNPSFNFLQFRSNLILRWEYSPGAAVYLVWSQGRTDSYIDGDFSFRNDMKNLFEVKPHNVFLVKFTYRFDV